MVEIAIKDKHSFEILQLKYAFKLICMQYAPNIIGNLHIFFRY